MKRALKNRVKAEMENTPSDDVPMEQLNTVVNPRVHHRRAQTKAAMIGLAISMGATSLLVTRQSEQALAAEPVGNQNHDLTIPAASDTEVNFAPTKKLESQAVSSVSVPENPAIVEPTAISQVPELGAKWQVAAKLKSVPSSAPVVAPRSPQMAEDVSIPSVANLQPSQKLGERLKKAKSADGFASDQSVSLTTQPQTVEAVSPVNSEVNAQLKAQQEFALNRLQEKSNRLRKSLAQLRSGENKDLSQAATGLAQPMTVVEKMPRSTTSNTTDDASSSRLVSRLKQRLEEKVPTTVRSATSPTPAVVAPSVVTPTALTPTVVPPSEKATYEVEPGDTLAKIALHYSTSVSELVKANNLTNPNQLQVSQKLTVPSTENRSTTTQTVVSSSTAKVPKTSANEYANNSSLRVPTSVAANNQIQTNSESIPPLAASTAITSATPPTGATTYTGMGGDSPVPTDIAETQQDKKPTVTVQKVKKNQRLRSLQEEIERLRAKYRAQQSGTAVVFEDTQSNNAAVEIPISRPNNAAVPILVPRPMVANYSTQPVKPLFGANQPANEPINPEFLPNQAPREQAPNRNRPSTRIATPSTGVEPGGEYLGAMRGMTVSPTLPPLAAVDRYLPKPIDETTPTATGYIWPTKGVLTSGYGPRWGKMHKGIDIANGTGTPVFAVADGVVEKAGWNNGGYGRLVDIRHVDGTLTRYGHNNRVLVQPGQQVQQGQVISEMGSTGFSTGPHLHFEVRLAGKAAVNPVAYLPTNRL